MSNFIEKSVQEIFDESMANAFIRDRVEPVEEVEETFRSTLASRMETDRQEKYEEEQRLIEIEEKKMYKGENATTSAEKNKEIVEKSVKNTITINPDIKETIVGKIYAAYNDRYLAEKKAKKDYDGDGKVESGAKEYRGVIHNKIQQKKGGKADGQDTSSVKEGMATPESGTGKYYVEGKPTKKQLEVRAQQAKNKAASDRGRMAESLKQARKNVGASTCWDGYTAKGTKMKGGKSVPNCVKEEDVTENRRVAHNPEKYKPEDESDKPYRQRSRENRMKDPKRGINSPAFKKFMADRGMSASYEPTLPMVESKKKL
mgnify:CR=1 FL=1